MALLAEVFSDAALDAAWERVHANGGASGVDGISLDAFEVRLSSELGALRADANRGLYRPQPYCAAYVPKGVRGFSPLPAKRPLLQPSQPASAVGPSLFYTSHL